MPNASNDAVFPLDPDALAKQIGDLHIRYEGVEDPRIRAEDRELLLDLYPYIAGGHPRVVRQLQRLVKRYPHSPVLKNHLWTALSSAGRQGQAGALISRMHRDHPDYLFGLVSKAHALIGEDKAGRVPELLGATLSLRDLKPEQDEFHPSEVVAYYVSVARFHLAQDRLPLAESIYDRLAELVDESHPSLQALSRFIQAAQVELVRDALKDDEARAIRVRPPAPSGTPPTTPPVLQHPELDLLYQQGIDVNPEELRSLLALPRESLVADLEAILLDAAARCSQFRDDADKWTADETTFPVHALSLLGELDAVEALPTVLRFLASPPDALHYWFGDLFDPLAIPPLVRIIGRQLPDTVGWMLTPGIAGESRGRLVDAVAGAAQFDPDRRPEVLAWFESVLSQLIETPIEDNVLDTDLITAIFWNLADLGAHELLSLITRCYEKGYVMISMVGDLEEMTESLHGPPKIRSRVPDLTERYRQACEACQGAADHPPETGGPVDSPRDPGRNDPCPCGSGRKYKRCCLDR